MNGTENTITLEFTFWDFDANYDFVYVYEGICTFDGLLYASSPFQSSRECIGISGVDTSGTLLDSVTDISNGTIRTITTTNTSLFLHLFSDSSYAYVHGDCATFAHTSSLHAQMCTHVWCGAAIGDLLLGTIPTPTLQTSLQFVPRTVGTMELVLRASAYATLVQFSPFLNPI